MNLVYICTNYNNSLVSINAIKSFLLLSEEFKCIVVDNFSDSKERQFLKVFSNSINKDRINIVYSEENLGYFSGLNKGLEMLYDLEWKYDAIVIGNNDLLFNQNFVKNIEGKCYLFEKYPVVSPNIITLDGVRQNPHVINDVSRTRLLCYKLYHWNYFFSILMSYFNNYVRKLTNRSDEDSFETPGEIFQGHGSCYILGKLFTNKFKYFYSRTFLFGEEIFLAYQMIRSGYKIFYEPTIEVIHLYHESVSKLPKKNHWNLKKIAFKEELIIRKKLKKYDF